MAWHPTQLLRNPGAFGRVPLERLVWKDPSDGAPAFTAAQYAWAKLQHQVAHELHVRGVAAGFRPGEELAKRFGGSVRQHQNKLDGAATASGQDLMSWVFILRDISNWPAVQELQELLPKGVEVDFPRPVDGAPQPPKQPEADATTPDGSGPTTA